MPLVAVPNVSTSEADKVSRLRDAVEDHGVRVVDIHVDAEHGRAVFTCAGVDDALSRAMAALAVAARSEIDLREHRGEHPRVGALDVCPFVPHEIEMRSAVTAARAAGELIGEAGIPVFFYGEASDEGRSLPEIRAGGMETFMRRVFEGLSPDVGPSEIDPAAGVVCVGARGTLIAFNVWIDAGIDVARAVASEMRATNGGPPGVRALGLAVSGHGDSQISMNLTAPEQAGIDAVFSLLEATAGTYGAVPVATEIVGLVPERFHPDPDAKAARLLIEPGRSLEAALRS